MEDLIKALRIFEKYCDDYHKKYPFFAVTMILLCSMVQARMMCHRKTL